MRSLHSAANTHVHDVHAVSYCVFQRGGDVVRKRRTAEGHKTSAEARKHVVIVQLGCGGDAADRACDRTVGQSDETSGYRSGDVCPVRAYEQIVWITGNSAGIHLMGDRSLAGEKRMAVVNAAVDDSSFDSLAGIGASAN